MGMKSDSVYTRQLPNKDNISKNWHIAVSQQVDI